MLKIIDVSRYQGAVDWDKVKASGVQGAFLKTVSTNYSEFGGLYIDPYFERNYAECKRVGIPVGAYYYTYAQDKAYADKELALFKQAITGKQFELPLVVDVEDNLLKPLSANALTDLVEYAVQKVESWGCYAMIYTYLNYQNTELNMTRLSKYDLWLAAYRDTRPQAPAHSIWQFTSSGSIPGVKGRCDVNWEYPINGKYHAEIIKNAGLNGFAKWKDSDKYYLVIAENCEYFNSPDVTDLVGKLPQDAVYEVLQISEKEINGFLWAKIKRGDGEYFAVILADRCRLISDTQEDPQPEQQPPVRQEEPVEIKDSKALLKIIEMIIELLSKMKDALGGK